jgi:hypothetical protein
MFISFYGIISYFQLMISTDKMWSDQYLFKSFVGDKIWKKRKIEVIRIRDR